MKHPSFGFVLFILTGLLASTSVALAQKSTVLHSGTWTKKSFTVKGSWKIIQKGDKRFIVLDENFDTKKAPDLKIFLSPLPLETLNGDNVAVRGRLISPLKSNKGAQRYEIPAKVRLESYKSIVIHCEKYGKLWSGAAL